MMGPSQSSGKLVWQALLSPQEIAEWAKCRRQPRKLWRVDGISRPGVYRFVFPEDKPPSCYIGVVGHLGARLRDPICPRTNQKHNSSAKMESGWSVRGAIQNSLGESHLQYLTIEGSVDMCGVILNQHCFEDYFFRLLLENWAIFHAERFEELRPINRDIVRGIQQGTKDFLRLAQGNIAKTDRLGQLIKRGGLETFF